MSQNKTEENENNTNNEVNNQVENQVINEAKENDVKNENYTINVPTTSQENIPNTNVSNYKSLTDNWLSKLGS